MHIYEDDLLNIKELYFIRGKCYFGAMENCSKWYTVPNIFNDFMLRQHINRGNNETSIHVKAKRLHINREMSMNLIG